MPTATTNCHIRPYQNKSVNAACKNVSVTDLYPYIGFVFKKINSPVRQSEGIMLILGRPQ